MATATMSPQKSNEQPTAKGRYMPDGFIEFNFFLVLI
jgi:hypothetical protein